MKSVIFAVFATVAVASVSAPAFAADQSIACSDESGFQVNLTAKDGALGSLSYGQGAEMTNVENVETSIVNGVGAAIKGNEVLFVITPAPNKNLGELVVAGVTHKVSCAK